LTALMGFVLLGIGWLGNAGIVSGDPVLMERLWINRAFMIIMIITSLGLYLFFIFISRSSYVRPKPKALRVRAGLMALDISYKRINKIQLVSLSSQYPLNNLRGRERSLAEQFDDVVCTAVDLSSWPWPGQRALRLLWHKFLFTGKKTSGLLFVVDDAMELNQLIDQYMTARQTRKRQKGQAGDAIDRAFQSQQGSKIDFDV